MFIRKNMATSVRFHAVEPLLKAVEMIPKVSKPVRMP
jgi:hypothetical protein